MAVMDSLDEVRKIQGFVKLNLYIYWVVISNIFYFHPYLGKIPILTNIFQMWLKPPTRFMNEQVRNWHMFFEHIHSEISFVSFRKFLPG